MDQATGVPRLCQPCRSVVLTLRVRTVVSRSETTTLLTHPWRTQGAFNSTMVCPHSGECGYTTSAQSRHPCHQVGGSAAIAPFVVVPAEHLDHRALSLRRHQRALGVQDA